MLCGRGCHLQTRPVPIRRPPDDVALLSLAMRVTHMIMAVVMRVRPMRVAVIVPMMVMVMVAVIMPVRAMIRLERCRHLGRLEPVIGDECLRVWPLLHPDAVGQHLHRRMPIAERQRAGAPRRQNPGRAPPSAARCRQPLRRAGRRRGPADRRCAGMAAPENRTRRRCPCRRTRNHAAGGDRRTPTAGCRRFRPLARHGQGFAVRAASAGSGIQRRAGRSPARSNGTTASWSDAATSTGLWSPSAGPAGGWASRAA